MIEKDSDNKSSNIKEFIKDNFRLFFYKKILHTKKAQKSQNGNKRLSLRYFYTPKNHKIPASNFHS